MKLGTDVHHTKQSKFSYSAKPDFPRWGFGGHLKKWPLFHHISETKRRRAIIVDSIYRFSVGRIQSLNFDSVYILWGTDFVYILWGTDFIESIAEYIMPLHPAFWKPFKKHGGHFQRNTSISETKRRRAFNFDSMSRFCGAYTCRKSIVSYVSVLGINHFDVYGGHFTKWRALP